MTSRADFEAIMAYIIPEINKQYEEQMTKTQKTKCPKDADETNQIFCLKTDKNGHVCTRKKGHTKEHHAHTTNKKCVNKWEETK